MRRLLLLLALLIASPALAQVSENVIPNSDNNETTWRLDDGGTACSGAACEEEIDESPASPDGLEVNTDTNNDTILIGFATPITCTAPSGTQTFDTVISLCATGGVETSGGTQPNYSIDLYCGGVSKLSIASAVGVTGLDMRTSHTWAWDATCSADGSNVEALITATRAGGGGNRRYPCVEAIEWECEQPATSSRRVINIGRK